MPRWNLVDPDGGSYTLLCDRDLPEAERVAFRFRSPLPSEVAALEQSAGHFEMVGATIGRRRVKGRGEGAGDGEIRGGRQMWVSNGPANAIKALLTFLVSVDGPGPDGRALVWPAAGDDAAKERFLGRFRQADLYEVAEAVIQGGRLTDDERGN